MRARWSRWRRPRRIFTNADAPLHPRPDRLDPADRFRHGGARAAAARAAAPAANCRRAARSARAAISRWSAASPSRRSRADRPRQHGRLLALAGDRAAAAGADRAAASARGEGRGAAARRGPARHPLRQRRQGVPRGQRLLLRDPDRRGLRAGRRIRQRQVHHRAGDQRAGAAGRGHRGARGQAAGAAGQPPQQPTSAGGSSTSSRTRMPRSTRGRRVGETIARPLALFLPSRPGAGAGEGGGGAGRRAARRQLCRALSGPALRRRAPARGDRARTRCRAGACCSATRSSRRSMSRCRRTS